jgi:phage tail protein X
MKVETILIAAAGAAAWHVYTKLTAIEEAIRQPQVVHLGIADAEDSQVKSHPVGFSSPGN